jgi:hypothetical protein
MSDFMGGKLGIVGGLRVSKIRKVIADGESVHGLQRTDIWVMRIFWYAVVMGQVN